MKYITGELVDGGDVVRLKHGGCKMTVEVVGVEDDPVESVKTAWFDADNKLHRERFPVYALELIEPSRFSDKRR